MKEAILSRPWIFILIGYLLAVSASITMVVIAVKHADPPVPIAIPHR